MSHQRILIVVGDIPKEKYREVLASMGGASSQPKMVPISEQDLKDACDALIYINSLKDERAGNNHAVLTAKQRKFAELAIELGFDDTTDIYHPEVLRGAMRQFWFVNPDHIVGAVWRDGLWDEDPEHNNIFEVPGILPAYVRGYATTVGGELILA